MSCVSANLTFDLGKVESLIIVRYIRTTKEQIPV
ncbi:hypothetical protein T4B_2031 [Trichinella pseudospiralis]|uniref:Uncharacterized protein n=1 Tax=Trichinella pseudospiralis TaxID=6337 RepID=A0A0V1GFQ0_TRIPS|nr:hypothetical protein T4B_15455 [Trichinella pseudospiralis]KRY98856.1 hypothetical protein T4B_2031 [Trichinella pseudospiralis]